MMPITISSWMIPVAEQKAAELPRLRNSIRGGGGNVIGFLGELLTARALGIPISNTYDYDLCVNGHTWDVKSKRCTSPPLAHYNVNVAAASGHQQPDYYFFVRVDDGLQDAWLIGGIDRETFYERATFYRSGEIDPHGSGFRFRCDCWNLPAFRLLTVARCVAIANEQRKVVTA